MKLTALVLVLVAACGGSGTKGSVGNHAGGPRAASVVFLGVGDHRVMEIGCWDPSTGLSGDCAARAEAAVAAKAVVLGDDRVRYTLTGRLSDECEASGVTMVAAFAAETPGAGHGEVVIAVAPPEADVDFRASGPVFDADRKPTAPDVGPALRAAVAARATADLVGADGERVITPEELTIVQVLDVDVDGDKVSDRLISATSAESGYANYAWSGVVVVPGRRAADARSVWHSDLEVMWFTGTLDIDGDGRRELVFASEYYEGSGVGLAHLVDGVLTVLGSYGCGA